MKKGNQVRKRLTQLESQDLILESTLDLMSTLGWSGVSFKLIADRCKTTAPNIIYHFSNRDRLIQALFDRIVKNNYQIVSESFKPQMNAFERLCTHFLKNLEWAEKFPQEAAVIIQIYMEAGHNQEFAAIFERMVIKAEARIEEHLMAGHREKILHFKKPSAVLAREIHNMLLGEFLKIVSSKLVKIKHLSKKEIYEYLSAVTALK